VNRNIAKRLQRLEAMHRPANGVFFMLWGTSVLDLDRRLADARGNGVVKRGDVVVRCVWRRLGLPDCLVEPIPRGRWVADHGLSCHEGDVLDEELLGARLESEDPNGAGTMTRYERAEAFHEADYEQNGLATLWDTEAERISPHETRERIYARELGETVGGRLVPSG
jgi:hypothetical protein